MKHFLFLLSTLIALQGKSQCFEIQSILVDACAGSQEGQNEMVVFLSDVEEFVGLDGNKMGPFEKGQIANIPKDIAKILIDGGSVESLEKN